MTTATPTKHTPIDDRICSGCGFKMQMLPEPKRSILSMHHVLWDWDAVNEEWSCYEHCDEDNPLIKALNEDLDCDSHYVRQLVSKDFFVNHCDSAYDCDWGYPRECWVCEEVAVIQMYEDVGTNDQISSAQDYRDLMKDIGNFENNEYHVISPDGEEFGPDDEDITDFLKDHALLREGHKIVGINPRKFSDKCLMRQTTRTYLIVDSIFDNCSLSDLVAEKDLVREMRRDLVEILNSILDYSGQEISPDMSDEDILSLVEKHAEEAEEAWEKYFQGKDEDECDWHALQDHGIFKADGDDPEKYCCERGAIFFGVGHIWVRALECDEDGDLIEDGRSTEKMTIEDLFDPDLSDWFEIQEGALTSTTT